MRLRSIWHLNRAAFFALDYIVLWAAVVCAFKLSPRYVNEILFGAVLNRELWFVGYCMPLAMAIGLQITGVQRSQVGLRVTELTAQTIAGIAGGVFVFDLVYAVISFNSIGRFVLLFTLGYGIIFILLSRVILARLAEHQIRNIFVYGSQSIFTAISAELQNARLPMRLVGRADALSEQAGSGAYFGDVKGLYARCRELGVDEIVVDLPDSLARTERDALLYCTALGINVVELGYFFERDLERVWVPGLKESWFWGYDPAHAHPIYFAAKRGLDICVSLIGILCFLPFLPLIALLVKVPDGGPLIYSQVRVGLGNRTFRIFKFRTMRPDAEKDGAQWAQKGDSRTTLVGGLLRRTRIDEVPQFLNILRGDMSFIGPRPERPEFVDLIEQEVPFYRYRHLIKPGLTGWAQVSYPYGASIEDARHKLSYDLYYMKYGSATRELHIMLRTIVAMVKGAR